MNRVHMRKQVRETDLDNKSRSRHTMEATPPSEGLSHSEVVTNDQESAPVLHTTSNAETMLAAAEAQTRPISSSGERDDKA